MSGEARQAARKAGDSPIVEWGARLGYAVSGLMHLLIGWLAVQVAVGESASNADQSGALATLARQPFGAVVLWLAVAGFALLAIWQLTEVVLQREAGDRAKAAGKAALYVAMAGSAYTFASGGRTSSSKQTKDLTATLMHSTGGRYLVGAVGLAVVGIGGYHIYKGWKQKFLQDLVEHPGKPAVIAGRIGYIAKGVALIVVGGLFVVAAIQHNASKSTGLDGALRTLQQAPFGKILLFVVALGIAAYGVYSFARAKSARV